MPHDQALKALRQIVGEVHVLTTADDRTFYSGDLFFRDRDAVAVVQPSTREELAATVKTATGAGLAVIARGGGLSYTKGYVPTEDAIVIDTRRLDRIVAFAPENMTVTAEAGCTWEKIYQTTAAEGLRPVHFGPTTGRYSTLGGGLANASMFFGSARAGTAADAVLGVEVVLADGRMITTGSAAIRGGAAFFRNHGPDLTGVFLNDAGALGIKSAATLRLERIPRGLAVGSWAFDRYEDMIAAAVAIGRTGLASECLGVGAYPPRASSGAGSPALHVFTEGWNQAIADTQLAALTDAVGSPGSAVEPAIPRYIRANPFGFVTVPLDATGRRQIWTHGIFPFGRVASAYREVTALLARHRASREQFKIDATISVAIAGTAALLEPVFSWPDAPTSLHRGGMAKVEASDALPNPKATDAVQTLRRDLRDLFAALGAAHLQVGKFYAYADALAAESRAVLAAFKQAVDPENRLNPGALGL